jgi:hypothetical protein
MMADSSKRNSELVFISTRSESDFDVCQVLRAKKRFWKGLISHLDGKISSKTSEPSLMEQRLIVTLSIL